MWQVERVLDSLSTERTQILTVVSDLADQLRRGQFSDMALRRYAPCSQADQDVFDDLLGRLSDTLTSRELSELQVLFQKCAYNNVYQRLYTVLQLENKVAQLSALNRAEAHHRLLRPAASGVEEVINQYVDNELAIAEGAMNLVRLQGIIIGELSIGTNPQNERINSILTEVETTKGLMSQLRSQNESVRETTGF
jgi:hypothetical protein